MPSGTEQDILRIINEAGGDTNATVVSRELGSWDIDYIRLVCNALARQGYIEPFKSREPLILTAKGWRATGVAEPAEAERRRQASVVKRQEQRGKGRTISLGY